MTGAGSTSDAAAVRAAVDAQGDPDRAQRARRFFKTGPGEYGEGDTFVGVGVPALRALVREFRGLDRDGVGDLLASPVHEHRLIGLLLLRDGFERATSDSSRQRWVSLYLESVRAGRVDNWDLVDSSASYVLGEWLVGRDRTVLADLAGDPDLWRRRVGVVATHASIRRGDASALLEVAPLVRDDRRDLIQKAFGWMLREVGSRCGRDELVDYLDTHAGAMGRTALSYATEHLDPAERARLRAR